MWLQTTNQQSQILHDRVILGYADLIDGQYVFQLRKTLELSAIANSVNAQPKKEAKPRDIKLWHSHMGHLGYKGLTILKNLSNRMGFKKTATSKLFENCQEGNQTCQPSRSLMSQSIKFLGQIYSDLEGFFP